MPSLPRDQQEAGPQSLLAILLGDYNWRLVREPVPAGVFVRLLTEFGITQAAARVALDRVCHRGLLIKHKSGRATHFSFSPSATQRHRERGRHIMGFGAPGAAWDGSWTLLLTSIPEQQRELRAQLRARLQAQGFARLYDAVWARPGRPALERASSVLQDLPEIQATLLSARIENTAGGGDPLSAFDLPALAQAYDAFIAGHAPLQRRARKMNIEASEALVLRTRLMDAWRAVIKLDPALPDALLPPRFPRQRARLLFIETYDALGPLAEQRLRQLVAEFRPDIAAQLRHHRSSDLLVP
jgi:phenylacetic acid degradation operon negative regulatory protein